MSTLLAKYGTYEEELMGFDPNPIVAHAGGGQGSATALTYKFNTITTCATDYDSCALIISKRGHEQIAFNSTAKTVSIYPVAGEKINGVSNAVVNIPAGESAFFICSFDGEWIGYIAQDGLELSASISLTAVQIKALHSSPQTIVPAVPGYFCQLQSLATSFVYSGVQYSGGGGMRIITNGATQEQARISGITGTASFFKNFNGAFNAVGGDMLSNKQLLVDWETSDPINGTGTVKIYVTYRLFQF